MLLTAAPCGTVPILVGFGQNDTGHSQSKQPTNTRSLNGMRNLPDKGMQENRDVFMGSLLRAARIATGLSRAQLAQACGSQPADTGEAADNYSDEPPF